VLEALGAVITLSPSASQKVLDQVGICFLFAPIYHPAMKHVGPARRELGFPTIFNMLGPLTNPAGARRQLIGVGNETAYELYPDVLMKLNAERVLVVRGEGGLDEATPYGTTRCREIKNGEVNDFTLTPEELGRGTFGLAELKAGEDAAANGEILKAVISGADKSGKREAVIWNAGLGLYVADKAASPAEGLKLAEEILDSGKAIEKLEQYIAATQSTE
jgi:anthranilate phosphoribosyltransferase